MLTSFLSEYLAQLFNVTIRVCCSTKYRKHNCVSQPEKLKGAFQGRNCVIYKYRAIEKNVNQGYLETKYNYWYINFHFSTRKNSFCTKSISKTDYLSISQNWVHPVPIIDQNCLRHVFLLLFISTSGRLSAITRQWGHTSARILGVQR